MFTRLRRLLVGSAAIGRLRTDQLQSQFNHGPLPTFHQLIVTSLLTGNITRIIHTPLTYRMPPTSSLSLLIHASCTQPW